MWNDSEMKLLLSRTFSLKYHEVAFQCWIFYEFLIKNNTADLAKGPGQRAIHLNEMSLFWRHFGHWVYWKLSKWQLSVLPTSLDKSPLPSPMFLSGEPDYFGRNKISSGGDLSHYSSASLY